MNIADNVLKQKLKNVYFIWGRGKTTVANILKNKFNCFIFSTDEARDKNLAYACPVYQPFMCRNFESEYGVNSFWELPKEVIADREKHFLQEVTPMIVTDLIAVCHQYETVICEGDIDYAAIIPISDHYIYLNNCGTKFDWFERPDHENIIETTNKRTNITDEEKAVIIQKAYAAVSGDESNIPSWVSKNKVKVISWNDRIAPEKTADETAEYFGLK